MVIWSDPAVKRQNAPEQGTGLGPLTTIGVEGLDLRDVAPGQYELICAPIKLLIGDGAPARVFLIER